MPTVSVFDMTGKKVSDLELAESIFGIEPSIPAMHLCVVSYLANQRQGTQSTLTTGFDQSSAVVSRRYLSRPQAP